MARSPKKKKISGIGIWDYDIRSLDLSDPEVIVWYLERKIEYNDWEAIDYALLKSYLPRLSIDEDKRTLLTNFIDWHDHSNSSSKRTP